jgi:glycerophosphoryl diester phosphodiesterase
MPFDVQGHRGARGLKPENTLPAFEAALDLGVSTLEFDLHLTRDNVPLVCHDATLSPQIVRAVEGAKVPPPQKEPRIRSLTLAELRQYIADKNPDAGRFPKQNSDPTPLAKTFAEKRRLPVCHLPTLADVFAFAKEYAADGGKLAEQRARAARVRFNIELKRKPFDPYAIGDGFDGAQPAEFEKQVACVVGEAGLAERTTVQSFDHRSVKLLRKLEPKLTGAVLVSGTAPASIPDLVKAADAQVYSPDYGFLDETQVKQAIAAKIPVIPWTVNDPLHMARLIDWGIAGIITDYPDRLIRLLQARHFDW